jgi:restriction system protein
MRITGRLLYTNEALRFAEGKSLELTDGARFAEMAKAVQARALEGESCIEQRESESLPERPSCPSCGAEMVLRRAKNGKNSGQVFWGCSTFPRCRGTRPVPFPPSALKNFTGKVLRCATLAS